MNIRELPDRLRVPIDQGLHDIGDIQQAGFVLGLKAAADLLEKELPVWTKMTEDEGTWPEDAQLVLARGQSGQFGMQDIISGNDLLYYWKATKFSGTYHWRPLCDLDRPPTTNEKE